MFIMVVYDDSYDVPCSRFKLSVTLLPHRPASLWVFANLCLYTRFPEKPALYSLHLLFFLFVIDV